MPAIATTSIHTNPNRKASTIEILENRHDFNIFDCTGHRRFLFLLLLLGLLLIIIMCFYSSSSYSSASSSYSSSLSSSLSFSSYLSSSYFSSAFSFSSSSPPFLHFILLLRFDIRSWMAVWPWPAGRGRLAGNKKNHLC